jgi:hypothetical protein
MKLPRQGIHVVENCIPPILQDLIEQYYYSDDCRWEVNVGRTSLSEVKIEDGPIIKRNEFDLIIPILQNCLGEIEVGYDESKVVLARAIMQPKEDSNKLNIFHVDTTKKCYTLVYYVSDCDGDTLFSNKTFDECAFQERVFTNKFEEKNYSEKVRLCDESEQKELLDDLAFRKTPKKGTAVIFDGSIYHVSTRPTKNKRCTLNFNYEWS